MAEKRIKLATEKNMIKLINDSQESDVINKEKVEGISDLDTKINDIKTADYGAGVNLLEITAESGTVKGISYTVDKESGTIFISGGQTGIENNSVITASYIEYGSNNRTHINEKYIISGCPEGGSTDSYWVQANYYSSANTQAGAIDIGEGAEYTSLAEGGADVYIIIKAGYTIPADGLLFKPMIRPATILDDTFYPYIKTNQQLQEDVAVLPENAKKNLLEITANGKTDNGVTFTVDKSTGIIKVSGTNTSSYNTWLRLSMLDVNTSSKLILSGAPTGAVGKVALCAFIGEAGTGDFVDTGGGVEIPANTYIHDIEIRVSPNQTVDYTFYPMLRPAGTSPDFVPYMRSNLELTHDTDGVRGVGRNLLKIAAESRTVNGVTFTVDEGKGTVTANGTCDASSNSWFTITGDATGASDPVLTLSEDCILTGCPSGGGTNIANFNYRLAVFVVGGDKWSGTYHDFGDGVLIPAGTAIKSVECAVKAGRTVSNIVFKPMLRSAKYTDDPTFYPYSEPEIDFQSKLRPITVGTMYDADNVAAVHNAHPRGKDITDIFNAGELSEMISSGLFDEIYPGDYFTLPIAAVTDRWSARTFTCRVMHLNPMKYIGDSTLNITDNHIGFATDESWFNCAWNESGTTEGGYTGSTIHGRINEEAIITAWQNALSGKLTLMQARMLLSNVVNTEVDSAEYPGQKGMASNWDWNTNYFKLMSEMERYGAPVWGSGKGFNTGTSNFQLAYYANNAAIRGNKRTTWDWLSDIVSVSHADFAGTDGNASYIAVTYAGYVHPLGFLKS